MRLASNADTAVTRALRGWVGRRLGGTAHEDRVAQVACELFDLTRDLHALTNADRRLLRWAALVHDIGRSVDADAHADHGAAMLLSHRRLPVPRADRQMLAYLTRHHRGPVPRSATPDDWSGLDRRPRRRERDRLRLLLALLRAADALDGRRIESPTLSLTRDGRRLRIVCYLQNATNRARRTYTRRKKFRMLEELLSCRVRLKVKEVEPARIAA